MTREKGNKARAARALGIRVPDTLVTNDVDTAADFCRGRRAVAKAVTWFGMPDGRFFPTTQVTEDSFDGLGAELQVAPLIFQEQVAKVLDVRVTCVGQHLFPVAIAGSSDPMADWRLSPAESSYAEHHLPDEISRSLRSLQASLGLSYGAIDLALDERGDYWFFEVNPQGAWLWLEHELSLPISSRIA